MFKPDVVEMGIRALLLAAGLGTRLRPITNKYPKCLVKVGGQPILADWLDKLETVGCEQTVVNTHYLHEQVDDYITSREKIKMRVKTAYESELLGTAGTIIKNQQELNDDIIIVIHADNFTNMDLQDLVKAHKERPQGCIMTMLTFTTDHPKSCGIVKKDKKGIITEFHEKTDEPYGDCANGAVYLFGRDLLEEVCKMINVKDFSTDVIPRLMGRIYSYHTDCIYIDIGTTQSLAEARSLCKKEMKAAND